MSDRESRRDADVDGGSHLDRGQVADRGLANHAVTEALEAVTMALRRQELVTGEILDAVAQIHRRELRARRLLARKCMTEQEVLAIDSERDSFGVPLTLQDQWLRIAARGCSEAVWITLLGKQLNSRAVIEIDDGNGPRRFTLIANQPIRLLEIPQSNAAVDVRLRRIRGEFGIAKIERTPASAKSERHGDLATSAQSPSTSARARSGITRYSSAELELKLWGGFARYAIPDLERLKCDTSVPTDERESAAWYLTRWYYVEQDYIRALENVEFCKLIRHGVRKRTRIAELQCLIKLGRYQRANTVLDHAMTEHSALDLPLIRSTVLRHLEQSNGKTADEAEAAQLDAINTVLASNGLAPLRKKRPGERLTLANIIASVEPQVADQHEKVSVVVPAFNCSATIAWVLDSILIQTWRNLEIVVVDDLSTDDTCEIVQRFCDADTRVRLIRKDRNDGAYATRNVGARVATGDLLMVHDSDDWSHPQRIELQVRELRKDPATVAVKSYWVRVSMGIEILGAWITRGSVFDLNFSSLLIRRTVLHEIGYWDDVAVAGDAELYSRLRSLYGHDSVARLPEECPLAFSLAREDSLTLSRATHLRSMFHGLRWNYRDAYLFWHDRLQAKARAAPLPFDPAAGKRPFPLPLGMRRRAAVRERYDLIVVCDFSLERDSFRSALDHLITAGQYRLRAAIFHWPQYESFARAPLHAQAYETCLQTDVDILSPGDSVEADALVFASLSILQYRLDPVPDIRAREVIVLACETDGGMASNRISFDPTIVRSHLRTLFQAEDVLVPASSEAAALLCARLSARRTRASSSATENCSDAEAGTPNS